MFFIYISFFYSATIQLLFEEAKKKEQAQKVKVNKYFMKYGKHY